MLILLLGNDNESRGGEEGGDTYEQSITNIKKILRSVLLVVV